ncbi:cellulase family glycosylhydrolase [bacterium]|nr:cellulase family glycosylhydrolase [bacterium]
MIRPAVPAVRAWQWFRSVQKGWAPMKKLFVILCILCIQGTISARGFLRTENSKIIDDDGAVLLRGLGIGGWMLQEGYMLGTADFAPTQHEIRAKIADVIGQEKAAAFYDTWLDNFCTETDIDSIAAWGFNSIRLPLHYNLFTLPIEQEPVQGQNTWIETGFQLTDNLLSWCGKNGLYLILDLHAAPGGQGKDAAISDYDSSKPSLWESEGNRAKTVALWKKLAERYADEPWVGGYDLINETNWNLPNNTLLRQLYVEITQAIREADRNHMIIIEGNWFANDFTGLTPPWDNNMVYSFHKYWNSNDRAAIQWMLNIRNTVQIPVWCGEAGENSNAWFTDAITLLEDHDIGWAWWPLKKIDSIAGPLSVRKPDGYQALLDYWAGKTAKPGAGYAEDVLWDLLGNIRYGNCVFQKGVIDAMIRQTRTDETRPWSDHVIPGMIFASEYDMGHAGRAYYDTESANYQVSSGTYTAWNNGWVFRNDGVDLETCHDTGLTNGTNVGWIENGEWLTYTVNVRYSGTYDVKFRIASASETGRFHIEMDDVPAGPVIAVPNTGGWQNWAVVTAGDVALPKGRHVLKLFFDAGPFNLNFFEWSAKDVEEDSGESGFNWNPASPNPFRRQSAIRYTLSDQSRVRIRMVDMLGREAVSLWNGIQDAGERTFDIDAPAMASGVYILEMRVNGRSARQKIMIIR